MKSRRLNHWTASDASDPTKAGNAWLEYRIIGDQSAGIKDGLQTAIDARPASQVPRFPAAIPAKARTVPPYEGSRAG